MARRILKGGLSVRQAERLASPETSGSAGKMEPSPADPNTRAAEERMAQALATRVRIHRKKEGGTLEIAFHNEEELERIFESIVR